MGYTADFQIIANSGLEGVSLIDSMTVEAANYLEDEADMCIMPDGYARLYQERVDRFIADAEQAHLCSEFV